MPRKDKIFVPNNLSPEERPLASFRAELSGESYQPLSTLADAKKQEDGIVILQGDDGGQIYVVARAANVKCSVETIEQLLIDLDETAWPGNDPGMRQIYYERRAIGSRIAGGQGGAVVSQEPWIHAEFAYILPAVLAVLRGDSARIR